MPDTQPTDLNSHRSSSPLHDLMYGHLYASALRAVALHGIADLVAGAPRTAEELAERAGLDAAALRRVLQLLAARGLFRQDADGAFALTDAGQALRTDVAGSQHAAVLLFTDEMFRRSAEGIEDILRTGRPGFEAAYGRPFFDHLAAAPDKSELFNAAMTSLTSGVNEQITRAYPFPEQGTVVDVGGGRGGLLRQVLASRSRLTGVLFDQPQTVADHLLDTDELRGRWRTEGGDFFAAVPEGGDLYLLKNVLHDWPDEDCRRILATIRRTVAPGIRLLVIDAVLPGNGAPHPALALDMVMLMMLKGRERTAADFEDLLASSGFRLNRIVPTQALSSVIEAEAV
ncbi:methyltransferase [Streptomyces sp. CA-132043]|uniref:methyltransferase n=1 Tax=Streptomyces sp. CA-132043 TaxID=3240048 RepID=UPI003D8BB515